MEQLELNQREINAIAQYNKFILSLKDSVKMAKQAFEENQFANNPEIWTGSEILDVVELLKDIYQNITSGTDYNSNDESIVSEFFKFRKQL